MALFYSALWFALALLGLFTGSDPAFIVGMVNSAVWVAADHVAVRR